MTFLNIILLVVIVLIIQAGLILLLLLLASKQMVKEKIRLQDQQMDAAYAKIIRLIFKFKKELKDYRELWPK